MKSVLISIRPKWCELIASGKKTVEVRKTRPAIEKVGDKFKCYIYMTKDICFNTFHSFNAGKVIGEFVCDDIDKIAHVGTRNNDIHLRIVDENLYCKELDYEYVNNKCCISIRDLEEYSNGGTIFGWHISDLKIYDKPKGLSEFSNGSSRLTLNDDMTKFVWSGMTRPPQSWCYVEEIS